MAPGRVAALAAALAAASASEAPLLEAAAWALGAEVPRRCAVGRAADCPEPWAAAEAWRYAAANALAASAADSPRHRAAAKAARAASAFFGGPEEKTLRRAGRRARLLREALEGGAPPMRTTLQGDLDGFGLGVPFPLSAVVVPAAPREAALQLRGGWPLPLLGLALPASRRPSRALLEEAVGLGLRHFEVSASVAGVVGRAIAQGSVARSELFLSAVWDLPLDSEATLQAMLDALGTRYLDLVLLPRSARDIAATWSLLEELQRAGLVRSLGVRGFKAEELETLFPGGAAALEVAQCGFTPYRHGPTRATWRLLGVRSVALVASGLFTDWPHALAPIRDPHVLAVASRHGREPSQILLRWALQLGLAVVFRASSRQHVAQNVAALGFELPARDMLLLSSLATLADPEIPPGDGFAHVYEPQPPDRGPQDRGPRQGREAEL